MSGFSLDWLTLREPADHRSVNIEVRAAFVRDFATRDEVRLTDIGCGSGSHLRSLAPHLGPRQSWRLVDYDRRLLEAASGILSAWADSARNHENGLLLTQGGKEIAVEFVEADLVQGLEALLEEPADAVTSAAFFDLASPEFISRLAAELAARRLPLYTILSYDGRSAWRPAHPADAQILEAFHLHQGSDKGFGPAAGPAAADTLGLAFAQHGFAVTSGSSPWLLGEGDRKLVQDLAQGIAQAAAETGKIEADIVAEWLDFRRNTASCDIGHRDIYARLVV